LMNSSLNVVCNNDVQIYIYKYIANITTNNEYCSLHM